MKSKYTPIFITIALIAIGAGVVFFNGKSSTPSTVAPAAPITDTKLDALIQHAQLIVKTNPSITTPYLTLAALYLQKVRETSDVAYYAKIDDLMDQATKVNPNDGDIPATRSAAAMGRHEFQQGYSFVQQAITLNSTEHSYYGLRGDADIELGKYTEAVDSFQKMVDIRPDFSSWSRIAYIRELYGDIPGAKEALNQAIDSGSSFPENIAWAYVELGKLNMRDDLVLAKENFTSALSVLPTYTQAMEGLGKVAFAQKDFTTAQSEFSSALTGLGLAQYAIDLGDLAGYQNDTTKASQYYALAQEAFAQSATGGVDTDLEESLFLSDHSLDLSNALQMATRAYAARPSIYGADYLAWALYKNGHNAEAAQYSTKALSLGENDPLILFHQGLIALANNDKMHAKEYLSKAYALSPHFSVQYADTLKTTLDSLK